MKLVSVGMYICTRYSALKVNHYMEMTASDWPTITIRSHGKIFSYIILSTFSCLSADEGIVYTAWWMWLYPFRGPNIFAGCVWRCPTKSISTPHLQTPLFIKSCSIKIALILLCSCIDVHFSVVILTPFKSFFYHGFGQ